MFSAPMAGEISPDIMFWRVRQKMVRMGVDGCRSIRMGVDGCIGKEGSTNKAKRAPNGWEWDDLRPMYPVQKQQEVGSDGHAGQRESYGEVGGKEEVCGTA
jgi:hypothetical protein